MIALLRLSIFVLIWVCGVASTVERVPLDKRLTRHVAVFNPQRFTRSPVNYIVNEQLGPPMIESNGIFYTPNVLSKRICTIQSPVIDVLPLLRMIMLAR